MKKNSQLLLMKVIPDFKSGPKYGYEQPRLMRTSYETIPPLQLETSVGVLSTVDMVVQRRDGPRRLRDYDDDTDGQTPIHILC